MARKSRQEEPGAIHHVWDRGCDRVEIFRDEIDMRTFLAHLGRVVERCGWLVIGYSLMPNHFHLIVVTPEPNLGKGMQLLLSDYVRIFNDRHQRTDALFGSRFASKRVLDDVQLWTLIPYVANNPVKAGLAARAEDWPWGSHAHILNGTAPEWLAVDRLLDAFDAFGGRPLLVYRSLVDGAAPMPVRAVASASGAR